MLNLLCPTGYVNPATPYGYNASYSATPTFVRMDNVQCGRQYFKKMSLRTSVWFGIPEWKLPTP